MEKKKREAEEEKRLKEVEEEKRRKEEQEMGQQLAPKLTTYRALYSFVARNADELSVDADCLIEVRSTHPRCKHTGYSSF